ncbi:5'-3' exoribonuclease 1 [Mycena sanguinolenta]|uniref:5'-3' exoribonuclease 1 n=1 Tax=Mycena sanguinolenta TaxID=230812 RepID=A0A8H7DJ27_9AGAR|nr:5'-3' exoribonuclease 1 [Mycena sanguinolenta]
MLTLRYSPGSHPNDEDAHFRLSEEQIITSIFAYVDLLFSKIKPLKLFFMAIDGVAPRAKQNQQRSRRFRAARDAAAIHAAALEKGEVLPTEKAFDSNCITPGTPFMARLSAHLRYFVAKKISEDANWRGVTVVLSGHDVPGEGEHKIMSYIRAARAQPGYDPNTRHCLYGLDADLIMLGLLSHDPHFCLLREEVKFGPSSRSKQKSGNLETLTFYLLHLSLMREYLDLEFASIGPALSFPYSLERIIDDFILLAVFVGNDFLPNLPDLHIHENGLERLFEVYKAVLPRLGGYINDGGVIERGRLQVVLDEMAKWEEELWEKEYADRNWYRAKQAKYNPGDEAVRQAGRGKHGRRGRGAKLGNGAVIANANDKNKSTLVLTRAQRDIFDKVKAFVDAHTTTAHAHPPRKSAVLTMPNTFPARDRVFLTKLAEDLHLGVRWDEFAVVEDAADGEAGEERSVVRLRFPEYEEDEEKSVDKGVDVQGGKEGGDGKPLAEVEAGAVNDAESAGGAHGVAGAGDGEAEGDNGEEHDRQNREDADGEGVEADVEDDGDEADWEDVPTSEDASASLSEAAENAPPPGSESEDESDDPEALAAIARVLKNDANDEATYTSFLPDDGGAALRALTHRYVEGLQWVMHYYFSGVASWGWFYDYHYAPRISDLRDVDKMEFKFELGHPFRPFEQLMGVLPAASREHIPMAYQDLMTSGASPIIDFYPVEFELDLNGKKQDWEAIVKIPFIDEERDALPQHASTSSRMKKGKGTPPARTPDSATTKVASRRSTRLRSPGFFPPLYRCTCLTTPYAFPALGNGVELISGLVPGVHLGAAAPAGFPSLKTLPHTAVLGVHGVNVHGSESRNNSMVVHIGDSPYEGHKPEAIARDFLGKRVFVGWPFLQEGHVVAVSDALFKYELMRVVPNAKERVVSNPHAGHGVAIWRTKAERIESVYSKRAGVITGGNRHSAPWLKRLDTGALVKEYEGADKEQEHALQMALSEVVSEDPRFLERPAPPLSEEFPEGSKIFFLGEHAYGVAAQVAATTETTLSVILAFFLSDKAENEKFKAIVDTRQAGRYFPSFRVADLLGMSGRALSKITSSFMVITADGQKTNLGLSLKFEAKALKVIDYSRKEQRHWEFSQKAVDLIREYKTTFPDIFMSLDAGGDDIAKASDILRVPDPDARVREAKAWLKSKGVRDFEPVSLSCDQLNKDTVAEIQKLADSFTANKSTPAIKKAIVKGIPRQAVLKPAHAVYRLQSQQFALGDRVTMVQDSGGVPLSVKGVVIGLNAKSMDVVWDVPFMAGVTLGDRCSQYRGSTVEFNTCLNLTNPQFVSSTNPKTVAPSKAAPPPAQRSTPAHGQGHIHAFRPPPAAPSQSPVAIMTNPNRGGGGGGGRGGFAQVRGGFVHPQQRPPPAVAAPVGVQQQTIAPIAVATSNPVHRGTAPPAFGRGRGGFVPGPAFRGRGGFAPNFPDRGRGGRGGFRARGRGGFAPPLPS